MGIQKTKRVIETLTRVSSLLSIFFLQEIFIIPYSTSNENALIYLVQQVFANPRQRKP